MAKNSEDDARNWSMGDMARDQAAVRDNWVVAHSERYDDEKDALKVMRAAGRQAKRQGRRLSVVPNPDRREGGYLLQVHENRPKKKLGER